MDKKNKKVIFAKSHVNKYIYIYTLKLNIWKGGVKCNKAL